MRHQLLLARASILAAVFLAPRIAAAGCGQAVCTVDTRLSERAVLGAGQLRFDLSTEYIEQDQPWVGFHSAEVGEIARPDHQEVDSTNVTWKLNTEVGVTERWSLALLLPIVHREHLHLADVGMNNMGGGGGRAGSHEEPHRQPITIGKATGVPERWNFTNLGDLQLTGRYSLLRPGPSTIGLSVFAGLKLPTGKTDVRNGDGDEAEITLQPGTGSVDPIVGATMQRSFTVAVPSGAATSLPAFLGVIVRPPGTDGRSGYRPGTEVLVNAGAVYPLMRRVSALGQINFRYRDRDHPGHALGVARLHTGGEYLHVSPGLQVALTDGAAIYSYVQVPVLQHVNGIQVVSRWNLMLGVTFQLDAT